MHRPRPRRPVHDGQGCRGAAPGGPGTGPCPESTLDAGGTWFFRTLPPTPPEYRNDKALADMMLGEKTHGYVGGAGSCAGCGEGTAMRMMVPRPAGHGRSMGIIAATGCNTVYTSTYPYNPYLVPWTNSLFENAPADRHRRPRRAGTRWAGRTSRCGASAATEPCSTSASSRSRGCSLSGMNIKVFVLDTQVYSNTGGHSPHTGHQLSACRPPPIRLKARKELGRILMAHGDIDVAVCHEDAAQFLPGFGATVLSGTERGQLGDLSSERCGRGLATGVRVDLRVQDEAP